MSSTSDIVHVSYFRKQNVLILLMLLKHQIMLIQRYIRKRNNVTTCCQRKILSVETLERSVNGAMSS